MICTLIHLGFLKRLYLKGRFVSHEAYRLELRVPKTHPMNTSEKTGFTQIKGFYWHMIFYYSNKYSTFF